MRLEDYDTSERYTAKVLSNERITSTESEDEVRELLLEFDKRERDFEVGQSIGVIAAGDPAFGEHEHLRLYSVADLPESDDTHQRITICVKRCTYVDPYNGELYKGVASNFLCDLIPDDTLTLAGPYGMPFQLPQENEANLILIGTGTGIAPFRTLVKHIYQNIPDWEGAVRLFYGAKSGLELLYMNDEKDDFTQYYDHDTFEAVQALSPKPAWDEPIAWATALEERAEELVDMLGEPVTYVYVAGLERIRDELDHVLAGIVGSEEEWQRRKAELQAGGRWAELLY